MIIGDQKKGKLLLVFPASILFGFGSYFFIKYDFVKTKFYYNNLPTDLGFIPEIEVTKEERTRFLEKYCQSLERTVLEEKTDQISNICGGLALLSSLILGAAFTEYMTKKQRGAYIRFKKEEEDDAPPGSYRPEQV